jgi:hypothetical protein
VFANLTDVEYAHVYFLVNHTGTAINTNKLLADGIPVRGRFDTVS